MTRHHAAVALQVFLWVCCSAVVGRACETPVYRYAMYRWQPAPYEIYLFHHGERDAASKDVEAKVEELAEETDNQANVVFLPVNLADDPELLSVPPDVKKAYRTANPQTDEQDRTKPPQSYLVSTPYGVSLYHGSLDSSGTEALVESPARRSLAAQLETGKVGVFVLLEGEDQEATKNARAVLGEVMADVAEGKVSLYEAPVDVRAEEEATDESTGKPKYELGLIELARDSKEEEWLVRSLLTIEPDLKEEKSPMVFLVYGRARALLPYIGPGITRENLLREVEFVSGACSCTVKEQNPGVDLLIRYDWESAAAALAEQVGAEEGNESSLGGESFFPELFIPSATTAADPAATETVAVVEDAPAEEGSDQEEAAVEESAEAAPAELAAASTPAIDETIVAEAASPASLDPAEFKSDLALSTVLMLGAGLIGAMVVLFGITLIVLRPQ